MVSTGFVRMVQTLAPSETVPILVVIDCSDRVMYRDYSPHYYESVFHSSYTGWDPYDSVL